MAKKPSLYIVERKEVILLIILFILVTVLSFTVGVKYGESFAGKGALEKANFKKKLLGATGSGGHLGEVVSTVKSLMGNDDAQNLAGENKTGSVGQARKNETKKTANKKTNESAKTLFASGLKKGRKQPKATLTSTSDEYLLEALKKAGMESTSTKRKKLPLKIKGRSGVRYVIQVGSFPSEKDATRYIRQLRTKSKKLDFFILDPTGSSKDQPWFRVATGKFSRYKLAEKRGKEYKKKGFIKNYFVRKIY